MRERRRRRGGAAGACAAPWRRSPSERGLLLAAAGTHPFARWEDQEIVDRPRYRELVEELGFIARRELIFGTHVHVAIEDPDRAIYVADGLRRYLPLLLALSANSPFWRGTSDRDDVLAHARVPRLPAGRRSRRTTATWESYSNRVEQMMRGGSIDDYTYLWWDVRPHPNLGTVETQDLRPADPPRAHDRARRPDDLAGAPDQRPV